MEIIKAAYKFAITVLKEPIVCFLFGGMFGSFIVAKTVVNRDVERKMESLSKRIKTNEVEKQRFLKNLLWVLEEYTVSLPKTSNDFRTREEWEAYMLGAKEGIQGKQENVFRRLAYGIEETNSMFEDDWTNECSK